MEAKDNKEKTDETKSPEYETEDEFNHSLAAMEEEIKPKIISTINALCKNYNKLIKFQNEKLNCALNDKEFTKAKEKSYKLKSYILHFPNWFQTVY